MKRLVALGSLVLLVAVIPTAGRAEDPDAFTKDELFIESADGVRLHMTYELYRSFTGPKAGVFGQGDHVEWGVGSDFSTLVLDWLDRHLKGIRSATEVDFVEVEEVDGSWRRESAWPPQDVVVHTVPVNDGAYLDVPGNWGESQSPRDLLAAARNNFPGPVVDVLEATPAPITGMGTWTFTQPLPHGIHVSGMPRLRVELQTFAPGVHLIALVYQVSPEGEATLMSRGAERIESAGPVDLELYGRDFAVPPGYRLGLLLTSSDIPWFDPGVSGTHPMVLIRSRSGVTMPG